MIWDIGALFESEVRGRVVGLGFRIGDFLLVSGLGRVGGST